MNVSALVLDDRELTFILNYLAADLIFGHDADLILTCIERHCRQQPCKRKTLSGIAEAIPVLCLPVNHLAGS